MRIRIFSMSFYPNVTTLSISSKCFTVWSGMGNWCCKLFRKSNLRYPVECTEESDMILLDGDFIVDLHDDDDVLLLGLGPTLYR